MVGSRCQFSDEAQKRGIKTMRYWSGEPRKYVGRIDGETPDGKCWLVVWDGLRHPRQIEKVLIEREWNP